MTEICPIDHEENQAKRISARLGLDFYINRFDHVIEFSDHKSESRPATDPELQMWMKLVPHDWLETVKSNGTLDAVPDELVGTFSYYEGLVYLNPYDLSILMSIRRFVPCTAWNELIGGKFGTFYYGDGKSASIYVSRIIPKGYILKSSFIIEDLRWHMQPGIRQMKPEIPKKNWLEMSVRLDSLICCHGIKADLVSIESL